MCMISFTVRGEPKAKGRPRYSIRKTKNGKSFATIRTPEDTVIYENLIRMEYERQCGDFIFEKDVPLKMHVLAYYAVPKSASKKKAKMMLSGDIRPMKKPDSTNVLKSIEDGLNRVAYYDDSQIVDSRISRFYSEAPRVEIIIREEKVQDACSEREPFAGMVQ